MANKTAIPSPSVEDKVIDTMQYTDTASSTAHAMSSAIEPSSVDLSPIHMFANADIVVKAVMIMLLLASIWSWAIILNKFISYGGIKRKIQSFEDDIWSGVSLEKYYDRVKAHANSPLVVIFVVAMQEWLEGRYKDKNKQTEEAKLSFAAGGKTERERLQILKDRIFQAMDIARNREVKQLEGHLPFLATVGSAAPFIGLFGTVWGIMNSFTNIAAEKSTSLAVVAPGIAEALFATAIGLFAAIPAVIFYNHFSSQLANFTDRIDTFCDEFSAVISRDLDE